MSFVEQPITLSPSHHRALRHAVIRLETQDFAGWLANYAGQPITRALRVMPKFASDGVNKAVERAVFQCLNIAIGSIELRSKRLPAHRAPSMLVAVTGGVSGFFGIAALPLELPVTTTLMLRAIADIARHHGEDLSTLEARLVCVEVFALGAPAPQRRQGQRAHFGYYASRALLGRFTADASAILVERGVAKLSAPVVGSLVGEIAARYGPVVAERAAASALPLLGALGGATLNVIFMNHFQRVAQAHFVVRYLERRYGQSVVRELYEELAARPLARS
jgi:hypothetical protein